MSAQPLDYLNDCCGHDSLIESIEINAAAKTVSVRLLAYPQEDSRDRKPIEFQFVDVESVTTSANLDLIADNAWAGNVNQWRLAEGPGASFFYLVDGYIAVTSPAPFRLVGRP